ncbi:fumarylacetoacetate hydrolase family protein [Rhodococcus sp. NPDC057529]|uniref:fumarylacetoacetate hydrolase family protein n=1 Tax=Rhodococcus sp. NPDC057529 TaxID=3346158 RepID=UPI00366F47A1
MRLARYGEIGRERPAIIDDDGRLWDAGSLVADITPEVIGEQLETIVGVDLANLTPVEGVPRLGPPIANVGKLVAVGLNYFAHADESNMTPPTEPIVFLKSTSSIAGPNDDIVIPPGSVKTDWEVELGVVIGKTAKHVTERDALSHVAGYLIVNDVSEREYQLARGGSWDKGKGYDSFGPLGPWLVTADEVGDPQDLALTLEVNGVRRQDGSTRDMIFDVATLVSYISQFMTLHPGDIVATGTPAGVGMGLKPEPVYLSEGDVVTLAISKLGSQRQVCVASSDVGSITEPLVTK